MEMHYDDWRSKGFREQTQNRDTVITTRVKQWGKLVPGISLHVLTQGNNHVIGAVSSNSVRRTSFKGSYK